MIRASGIGTLGCPRISTSSSGAGLLIGLVYGAVGLLSGFCLLSSLRGWWAEGDSRLIRTYALALGVAIAATQLSRSETALVDLGKSIYLQPSFSAPLMFAGGLLFGYGMVLCERLRLARAGAARPRQSAFVCRGDRARHRRADDAEGPDRAGADRACCRYRRPRRRSFRCRRCCRRSASARPSRGCWRPR